MRYPCRAEQGLACCYSEKCAAFVGQDSMAAQETVRTYLAGEQLLTTSDCFIQGFMVGAVTVLLTGVVILWYLTGGIG